MHCNKFVAIIALGLGLSVSSASAALLTFDDVPLGSNATSGQMPAANGAPDYQGFLFSSNMYWINTVDTFGFGAVSGSYTILNNTYGVGVVTAADGSDFTFDGIHTKKWATAANSGGPANLLGTLSGWNNGAQVWSVSTALNGTFQYFSAQFGAIDELRMGFGDAFLADSLALNESISAVPLPAAFPLFAGGLGLLGLVGWRRKRAATATA